MQFWEVKYPSSLSRYMYIPNKYFVKSIEFNVKCQTGYHPLILSKINCECQCRRNLDPGIFCLICEFSFFFFQARRQIGQYDCVVFPDADEYPYRNITGSAFVECEYFSCSN
jgi:hypothetical protein